jgi:hypothetical protein
MLPFSRIIAVGGYPSNAAIFAVFVEGEANLLIKAERSSIPREHCRKAETADYQAWRFIDLRFYTGLQ